MRFYNPQFQQPISTFVPDATPWDMILKAGEAKEKLWAETEKDMAEAPNMFNLKIKPYYTDSRGNVVRNVDALKYEEKQKELNQKITALADKDLSDYTVKRELQKIKSDAANWLNTYGKSAEATSKAYDDTYTEWKKAKRTDDSQGRAFDLDRFVHEYQGADKGSYEGSPIGEYVDLDKIVSGYAQGINAEMTKLNAYYADAVTKGDVKGIAEYKNKLREITGSKVIKTVSEPAWLEYQSVADQSVRERAYWNALKNGTSYEEELVKPVSVSYQENGKTITKDVPFYQYEMLQEKQNVYNNAAKYVSSEGDINVNFSQLSDGDGSSKQTGPTGYYTGSGGTYKNPLKNLSSKFNLTESQTTVSQSSVPGGFIPGGGKTEVSFKGADVREFNNNTKTLIKKIIRKEAERGGVNSKQVWDAYYRIEQGKIDLTPEQKKTLYPLVSKYIESIPEVTLSNTAQIPYDVKVAEQKNFEMFGDKQGTNVKDLGTGISPNMLFLDENGNEVTVNDIKKSHVPEDKIVITSKLNPQHGFNLVGGNQDYTNSVVVNIGGKQYITQDRKYAENTPEGVIQEQNMYENKAYSAMISGLDEEIQSPFGTNVKYRIEKIDDKTVNVRPLNNKGIPIGNSNKVTPNSVYDLIYNLEFSK